MNKKMIEKDLETANRQIEEIVRDKNPLILKPRYLEPTMISKDLPLLHEDGGFQHYARIRDVLKTALDTGSVPESLVVPENKQSMANYYFKHLPDYVKDLVKEGE